MQALAGADLDDVLAAWAGLGYYSPRPQPARLRQGVVARARRHVSAQTESGLRELPGIGPYTAAAIAAIAFGEAATPVDGNVERVVARLFARAHAAARRQARAQAARRQR